MNKQNVFGVARYAVMLLVLVCVAFMFVACGNTNDNKDKTPDENEQALILQNCLNTISSPEFRNSSYTIVGKSKQIDPQRQTNGTYLNVEEKYEYRETLNAQAGLSAYTYNKGSDETLESELYVNKVGDNYAQYLFEIVEDVPTYTTTKVSATHAINNFSLSNEVAYLTLLGYLKDSFFDSPYSGRLGYDSFARFVGLSGTALVDDTATISEAYSKTASGYKFVGSCDGMLSGKIKSEIKTAVIGKFTVTIEFNDDFISKVEVEISGKEVKSKFGETLDEKTYYDWFSVEYSNTYDASLMPANFDAFPSYGEAEVPETKISYRWQYKGYSDASDEYPYGTEIPEYTPTVPTGAVWDGKWYSDVECTEEATLDKFESYDITVYGKLTPAADYARVITTYANVDYSETYNYVYSSTFEDVTKTPNYDWTAALEEDDSFVELDEVVSVKVNGKKVVGDTFAIESGKSYSVLVEYKKKPTKVSIATQKQGELFKNEVSSIERILAGDVSYTMKFTSPENYLEGVALEESYDKDAKKYIISVEELNSDGSTYEYSKTQIKKVDDSYELYLKDGKDGTFYKHTVDDISNSTFIVPRLVTIYTEFTLTSYVQSIVDDEVWTNGRTFVSNSIRSTADSLIVEIVFEDAKIVNEFKFSGGKFVGMTTTNTVNYPSTTVISTKTCEIAYSYDSTLWEDVSDAV